MQGEGKEIQRVFKHIPCRIEAEEAEEVGVEHLLRDINDPTTSTLAMHIRQKVEGLKGFVTRLEEVRQYLQNILSGVIPVNNQILYNLQNIFNLLPNLNIETLVRAMMMKTNDMHLVVYLATLVRSVIALHNLLNNKIQYRDMDDVLDRGAGVEQNMPPNGKEPTTTGNAAAANGAKNTNEDNKMEE